ncbi:nuclear transport factor 2 family protein [Nocardia cyriacigeorgica]|uniref:nuclear transport factor 2 family protein n=1 Tax=Nocardia cyriacigeorgica TaxID=135487 RepID=UPI001C49A36C|nr:nuclear transport factor 2 family protein [Nocardia cyriacigeorgica]
MHSTRMFELAQQLADAKSNQDLTTAMRLLHPDVVLEAPAFGTITRGTTANEAALRGFFRSFPDYEVRLHGHAEGIDTETGTETLICWGAARMTLTGTWFGDIPNGARAEVPVFIQFTFADDLIAGERFFFDLSTLCSQSGVSTDTARRRLFEEPNR